MVLTNFGLLDLTLEPFVRGVFLFGPLEQVDFFGSHLRVWHRAGHSVFVPGSNCLVEIASVVVGNCSVWGFEAWPVAPPGTTIEVNVRNRADYALTVRVHVVGFAERFEGDERPPRCEWCGTTERNITGTVFSCACKRQRKGSP